MRQSDTSSNLTPENFDTVYWNIGVIVVVGAWYAIYSQLIPFSEWITS